MNELINDILTLEFLQLAILGCILVSICAGLIGTGIYIMDLNNIIGGASHAVLGGIGFIIYISYYLKFEINNIFFIAILSSALVGLIIYFLLKKNYEAKNTIINLVWSFGMAIGFLFIFLTPGYQNDIDNYLFGNILLINQINVWFLLSLAGFLIIITWLFFNRINLFLFNSEISLFLLNINFYRFSLIFIACIGVGASVQIAGIIPAISLFSSSALLASLFAKSLKQMIIITIFTNIIGTIMAFITSYYINIPLGINIAIFLNILYIMALLAKKLFHKSF